MAIQQANPTFGLNEGIVQLYIQKGDIFLTLSPVRIKASSINEVLGKLTTLATEMLTEL